MMKRLISLIVLTITVVVISATTASAQACFDDYTSSTRGPQEGPGRIIGNTASGAAHAIQPGSLTPMLAQGVGVTNQAREELCQ